MVTRSVEMIVSILAVLKSGGSYIPIDPAYPQERIEYMLNNSNSKFLLTFEALKDKVSYNKKIFVELENSSLYSHTNKHLKPINKPTDSSYIIYTSGSTGLPKGVVLNHKALSNLTKYCHNYVEYLKDNKYRTIVSVTTVSFDIFIFETLISLTRGLKLVIANEDEQNIPRLLNNLIEKYDISIIQTTPARMQIFVNNYSSMPMLKNLKYITLAGEPLPITLANRLKEISGAKIYNGYGPSETTVFSTLTDVTDQRVITIGKPLSNTQIYILDKNLHLVPIGYTGELYIAGDGVGKGYLNNPELTNKSFLPNLFTPGTIMYKSGDLGCYLPNGEILCLGRSDNQVKIRGLRIELEEIEHKILDNKDITSCVVAKKVDENSHEFLCAYYTATKTVQVEELRAYLSKQLPNYMVPQYFMELEKLPYTPNGKVNRKVLPLPKLVKKHKTSLPPRNNTDKELLKIIQDLLNIKDISINDSFFEIGGDSLTAINLCTCIYDTYSIDISVKDIFEHPILSDLSDFIQSRASSTKKIELIKCPSQEDYPVSNSQKGVYYSSIIAGTSSVIYNVPGGLFLSEIPDVSKLEKCFQTLISRHEVLRTYFIIKNEELFQKIEKNVSIKLEVDEKSIDESQIKKYFNKFVKPFDLSKAPLLRVKLVYIKNSNKYKSLLLIDMHHIICDGTSLQILTQELCTLYNNNNLQKLEYSYKDFVWTELKYLNSDMSNSAKNYFISQLNGKLPVLSMPTAHARPAVQNFDGKKIYFSANENLVSSINEICKNSGITPYMFTLAAYYILLYIYSNQNDIIVGSPIIGRNFTQMNSIIGMFVNTLPIRAHIDSKQSFKDFLLTIKEKCLNNYRYQLYPFDTLLKILNVKRDPSRNPIYDTIFTFQNTKKININLGNINADIYSNDVNISKYDLSLEIVPSDNSYNMNFEYCTLLFNDDFMQSLCANYLQILELLVSNIDITIKDINIDKNNTLNKFVDTAIPTKVSNTLPRNEIDKKMLDIIKSLMNIDVLYVSDSLFDLGGDSLTAINLCTRIYDDFNVQLYVKDIFEHPIIMELSDIISSQTKKAKSSALKKAPANINYPVSYAEQSIYFASIMAGNNSVNYNIPCGLFFDKMPNIKKLELSFQALIKRHEVLRTFFEFNENSLVQKVQKQLEFNLDVVKEPILESEVEKYYNEFIKPFDLSTPPLFKTKLLRIKDSEKYQALLLFDIHHIICDGTSLNILIDDLCAFYNSENLPALTVTYKDFSFNEKELLSSNKMKEAETYWISHLENNLPVLRMPTNYPRPAIQSFNGSKVYCSLSSDNVKKIEDICKKLEITPYIFTLAAYYVLLYNYTAQDDIVIGSPYSGRTYQEIQNIVGMFVNTLPIRAQIDRNSSFEMLLKSLKDICFNAYKYQSYPFELLVRKLNIPRNTSRNPIFDTIFVFQNTMKFDAKFKDLNVSYYSNDNKVSKFDLSLEIVPNSKGFDINFEYCTDLFTRKFIQTLSTQYIDILKQVISNINTNICDININSESENLLQLSDTALNDIEHAIYQYPNIDKAHVQLDSANKIVAYYSSTHNITASDLKAFIQRKLPSYFIPEHFIQLDKLKLNAEGKIDEKVLNKLQNNNNYEEPSTKNQKILAQMFKDVLKLNDVSINDNFFEIGGDSLYAIQLQIEAFNKGLEFSYRDIFTYPTIKQLAEQISKSTSHVKRDNYDYSKLNELLSKNTGKIISKKEKIKNILLTGATGYMGSHIIDNLIRHTKCNIYCLIRAKNNMDPQARLLDTLRFYFGPKYDKYIFNRIFVIEGDITAKNFKLTKDLYNRIGNNVSCVINSAAIVKHYGNSEIFNTTNVSGTQNIIDFCLKFNCKLIHLSTLSVSGNIFETDNYQVSDLSTQTIFSEKDLYIGQDLSNIYIHTKFIAERLILENILNNNLNAKIIRLGNITNRYSDGAFQINVSENAFINRIHSFLQLGCFPDYLLDNYMEFTPVDYCADAVVKIALQSNNYTVFHVYNNNHITFRELKEIFDKLHYDMQIVTKEEFNTKVKLLSSNPETKNYISGIINDFGKDKQLKYYTNIQIKNDFTNKLLNSLLFRWPKINRQYINKYLIYLRSIGYIK